MINEINDQMKNAIENLKNACTEENLWQAIVAFQNFPFYTASGLPFYYSLKTGRNGELTKELWVNRRENSKSLAWSSVVLAFQHARQTTGEISGSEKTGKHPRNFLYLFHFLETGTDKSPSINCRENEVLIYIFAGQYTNI